MKTIFLKYLRANGIKEGLILPVSNGGSCITEEGTLEADFSFGYLINSKGRQEPIRTISTRSDVFTFLDNIVEMGGKEEYIPHRCGIDDSIVRAGLTCSSAIVKNVYVKTTRPEGLRQPPLE